MSFRIAAEFRRKWVKKGVKKAVKNLVKVVKRLIFWHNRRFSTIGKWLAPKCGPRNSGLTRVGYRQI